jgi:hypothetical protein
MGKNFPGKRNNPYRELWYDRPFQERNLNAFHDGSSYKAF